MQLVAGSGETVIPAEEAPENLPFLSVAIPARNEERQIERCIRSLLAQTYPRFEIVAVDDRSDDSTLAILERLAATEPRLRVVRGEPLPAGWVGKPWALAQAARRARGDWLLCTDADTAHAPRACAVSVDFARRRGLDILSLLGTQELRTSPERAILPSILWSIALAVGPLEHVNDPHKAGAALFNGQYILFRRSAYDALGGHGAVRGEVAEDYEFARLVKADGRFRAMLANAEALFTTRMYRSFGEIWRGFAKNLYLGVREDPPALVAGVAFFAFIAPLPELLFLRALRDGRVGAAASMAVTIAVTAAAAELGMRKVSLPRGSGLYLPLGITVMLGILLDSTLRHTTGRGVRWRGRRYGRRDAGSPEISSPL